MTTKKQRREQVAARNQAERAALANANLEALKRSKDRQEQKAFERERAENKKKAAQKIKEMAQGKDPDNLLASADAVTNAKVDELFQSSGSYGHAANLVGGMTPSDEAEYDKETA